MSIRVGVIGTGWVAQDRYLPSLLEEPRAHVVALADHNLERAASVARRFKIPGVYHDQTELFETPLDAVVVCTPPATHFELASQAISRGLHVLVEKPLAIGLPDAEKLVAMAAAAGVKASVAHNVLWSRSVRQAAERVASGAAGRVMSVRGIQLSSGSRRLPRWYPELPGGLFYDEAPHLLYLLRAFAGELDTVFSRAWDVDHALAQPIGHVEAAFDGELAPAHISMDFRSPVSEWFVIITCSERVLGIDLFRDAFVELRPDGGHRSLDVLRSSSSLWIQQALQLVRSGGLYLRHRLRYGHERLVREFLASIVEDLPEPAPFSEGARVVGLMDDVLRLAGCAVGPSR